MNDYEVLSKYFTDESKNNEKSKDNLKSRENPYKNIDNFLKEYKFDNLLDLGCGNFDLIHLLFKNKKADYYCLCSSLDKLKKVEKDLNSEVELIHGNADNIPFDDNTFDLVTCVESFHNYINPQKVTKEIHRILKPNGICILFDKGHPGESQWIDNHFVMKQVVKSGKKVCYGRNDIENIMKNNKFCIIKSYDLSNHVYTVISQKL